MKMAEIILQRILDTDSEKNLQLKIQPPVIVGRGPTLKCGEKKVSRKHASIDWDDDGILISSVHVNPTFVCVNGEEKTLHEGQSASLKVGDKFGLLKESFWFRVAAITSQEKNGDEIRTYKCDAQSTTIQDSKVCDNEDIVQNKETPEKSIASIQKFEDSNDNEDIVQNKETREKSIASVNNFAVNENGHNSANFINNVPINNENIADNVPAVNASQPTDLESDAIQQDKPESNSTEQNVPSMEAKPCITRERKLPAWLLSKNAPRAESTTPKKASKPHGKASKPKTSRQKGNDLKDTDDDDELHDLMAGGSGIQSPVKKGARSKTPVKATPRKGSPRKKATGKGKEKQYHTVSQDYLVSDSDTSDKETKLHGISDESEADEKVKNDKAKNDSEVEKVKKVSPVKGKNELPKESDQPKKDSSDTDTLSQTPAPRQSCEYGENCYRKNPTHRQSMAHPGDNDYVPPHDDPVDTDDDERPECEFGLTCYRKNPQHKRDYKHTRKPQPQRQAKRKAKRRRGDDDDDSENDYDFDDPFLNDDSSDDYAPTDSTDQDSDIADAVQEDDTKRMLKEATKFVKKRKK